MLGNRDSEVAMLIEDTDLIPSYMDGKEVNEIRMAWNDRDLIASIVQGSQVRTDAANAALERTPWPSQLQGLGDADGRCR